MRLMMAAMFFVAAGVCGFGQSAAGEQSVVSGQGSRGPVGAQNVTGGQATQRQKMIHMAAVRIADQIGVTESKRESFVAMYQAYKKEAAEIMATEATSTSTLSSSTGNVVGHATVISNSTGNVTDPETAAEQKILSDFDKSQKILDLRKAYYAKFRTILSPTQIQQMYNAERSATR